METLLHRANCVQIILVIVFITFVFTLITWVVCFCIRVIRRWLRMMDYNKFVCLCYTNSQKDTPTMILRIQNSYIHSYNSTASSFLGRVLRLKIYPQMTGKAAIQDKSGITNLLNKKNGRIQ